MRAETCITLQKISLEGVLQTMLLKASACDYTAIKMKTEHTFLEHVHSGQKCLPRVACLWSKKPMFQRAGMREGGEPLPVAFQYLILMI